ncbi:hypothetical protein HYQ46_004454 [Verticillium longisporum]|nr:hypothetical protein HYQ46_004454 [Verticillium longisporum]
MMGPLAFFTRALVAFEDIIVRQILKSPGFHRGVGRIHKMVHERKYGRNPHEPLYPGEATEDHSVKSSTGKFRQYFVQEIKDQWKGTVKDYPPKR